MNIKKKIDKTSNFILNRLSELIGLLLLAISSLLFISLVSYSPEDPNFIFPNNLEIKNLLGIKGSYVSDIFLSIPRFNIFINSFFVFFTIN